MSDVESLLKLDASARIALRAQEHFLFSWLSQVSQSAAIELDGVLTDRV